MSSHERELGQEVLLCARYGEEDDLKAMLDAGGDVNYADDVGSTALHMASANGHAAIVRLLLRRGAHFRANASGNTPLHWAVQNGHEEAAAVLLANCDSALVLAQNKFGKSALTEAFSRGSADLLTRLLEHNSAAALEAAPGSEEGTDGEAIPAAIEAEVVHSVELGAHRSSARGGVPKVKVRETALCSGIETLAFAADPCKDRTGVQVWAASVVLAHWLCDHAHRFKGLKVCELGAGCGLPGLALATCCPEAIVVLSDLAQQTLANLEHNVTINEGLAPRVCATAVDWNDPATWPAGGFDAVIGSDLVYSADMVPPLLATVHGLLPVGGIFVYSAPVMARQGAASFADQLVCAGFARKAEAVPEAYLSNCLAGEEDEAFDAFFEEMRTLPQRVHVFTKLPPATSRWAYLPSWARAAVVAAP